MTDRRGLIGAAIAATGAAFLAAPGASATTAGTSAPQLVVTRVTYDYYRHQYVGTGTYGADAVKVYYTYSYRYCRWIARVEPVAHERCTERWIECTNQWTCFNGCWYPVYIVKCGFHEEGGSGSSEDA